MRGVSVHATGLQGKRYHRSYRQSGKTAGKTARLPAKTLRRDDALLAKIVSIRSITKGVVSRTPRDQTAQTAKSFLPRLHESVTIRTSRNFWFQSVQEFIWGIGRLNFSDTLTLLPV